MKVLVLSSVILMVVCNEELVVTKEYVELLKSQVTWEVEEYENNVFKGWTVDEVKQLLGLISLEETNEFPEIEPSPIPSSINWAGGGCDHGPKSQGNCGSCWAFAATGMLSYRCCKHYRDMGWLSPQELVSCDKGSQGCMGGSLTSPLTYFAAHGGLVRESCYHYQAKNMPCPTNTCDDGKTSFRSSHVCKCGNPLNCASNASIKYCLNTGPTTMGFSVCKSFLSYKSGIYHCDCTGYLGSHAVLIMGYSTKGECHYHVKNSWGPSWGNAGYFDIGCDTCRIVGGSICGKVTP